MVGLGRFELPTSPLSGVRSSQLSYRPSPKKRLAGANAMPARSPLLVLSSPSGCQELFESISRTQLNVRTGYAGRRPS